MDQISFTTFLKISLMPTTQGKFGTLQRMLNGPGGFDFYKRMKLAAQGVARGETPREEILAQLSAIKRPSDREHNLAMGTRFCEWWDSLEGANALPERPSGIYQDSDMVFGIKLRPELAYDRGGIVHVTYLWATRSPKLTHQAAGAGLLLLKTRLGLGPYQDAHFQIRDLRQGKTFGQNLITNQSASILKADIALMNSMWGQGLNKAA